MTSLPLTGWPSKRSTARRLRVNRRAWATSASSATRSHSSPGSRRGTSERPPRSTKRAGLPPSSTTYAPATRAARAPARFGHGRTDP